MYSVSVVLKFMGWVIMRRNLGSTALNHLLSLLSSLLNDVLYSMVWVDHHLFNFYSICDHSFCFQIFAIGSRLQLTHCCFYFWGKSSQSGSLGHRISDF